MLALVYAVTLLPVRTRTANPEIGSTATEAYGLFDSYVFTWSGKSKSFACTYLEAVG